MNREGFRNRLKQYKEAKGFDPQLSYWEWKQKYDSAPQPDSMPSQPQPDQSTAAPQPLDDRAHRWDNGYSNVNRDPFDSPYDDSRYHDYRKPRFEFRKGDVHYSNPNVLKWMGRFGKVLRGGSLLGEVIQNLFPSEEAEAMEALRVKMDKQNKQLTGQEDIPMLNEGGEVGDKKATPTQEEYIAEQIAARKAAALEKSLSRTMPRVPQGIKTGERWNPVTNKVEDIHECGPSCAYTFSDNYGQNWTGSEDFKQNHTNYGWKQVPWEQRQPGDAVLIVDDKGTAKHTMMYDSDNSQGQPLFNHSNGGRDESAIRKKAKYPHHNPYLIYEFVGTPADSTQWINDYKKIYGFADGGEVTGPPTYEQWYNDVIKYNPTILDNASMYWSIEAAKKALHNEAMGLPEYAPMWNNYVRSLPKADPDINQFIDDLWANENPNNVGYRNGKYYPHKSPEGGKMTIGPGFKLGSGQHKITEKQAKRGITKSRLDQEARRVAKGYFKDVDDAINSGQTTNPADTVSPQIKAGLADILHQTGSLKKWPKLINAVREGDLEKIQNEAIVTWRDNNGILHEDKRRNELRNKKNWHYAEGGEVNNPYSAGRLVDSLYGGMIKEEYQGEPWHKYDFTISEEEAEQLGYFKDERGHRDDRVKKEAHPSHPSRGNWKSFYQYDLTDFGMNNPNHTLFGLVDGGQDPQAVLTYKNGIVLPELTVTPKKKYVDNTYDNIHLIY